MMWWCGQIFHDFVAYGINAEAHFGYGEQHSRFQIKETKNAMQDLANIVLHNLQLTSHTVAVTPYIKTTARKPAFQLGLGAELRLVQYDFKADDDDEDDEDKKTHWMVVAPEVILDYHDGRTPVSPMLKIQMPLAPGFGFGYSFGAKFFVSRSIALSVAYSQTTHAYETKDKLQAEVKRTGFTVGVVVAPGQYAKAKSRTSAKKEDSEQSP